MTTASIDSLVEPGEPSGLRAFAHRHWRVLAILVLWLGPFVPSILAMQDFLLADNALRFTPFALPLAMYLFWLRAHSHQAPSSRDVLIDSFFFVPLMLAALFILFVTPAWLSWYFWLNRMDLAAMAQWVAAVAFVFLGYQQMLRTWPAWVLLVFAWPYPAVWLQGRLTSIFVDITAWTAQQVVGFLRLPYNTDPGSPQWFESNHLPADDNFTLIVGQLCSGTSVTMGFLVVGAGLVLMSRGRPSRRVWWLLSGLALAFFSNLVRVSILLILAARGSREFAVEQVHPVLGIVLFRMVVLTMLVLMQPFRLRFDPVPHGKRLAWEPGRGGGRPLKVVWVLAPVAA